MEPFFKHPAHYFKAVLLPLAVVLGGCAGMASGVKNSAYRQESAPSVEETRQDLKSNALVIIRYPALLHADAETIYVSSFASRAIGGEVPLSMHSNPQTSRTAHGVISKSSYYAMSLYRELRKALPEGTVLLSPHIIDWSEEKGLYSRPILASEQVPSVLTVDFNVYSFPDVNEMMESPPVTFGDLVTPLMVVRTSPWGQPALNGLQISSDPLIDAAWRQTVRQVRREAALRISNPGETPTPSLVFIDYLSERDPARPSLPLKGPADTSSNRLLIERYPLEKIQMDGTLVAELPQDDPAEQVSRDPFARDFASGAAARLVRLLGTLNQGQATFFARQSAFARFDPELASVFYVRSDDESVRARLQLAEALVAAEREFLAAQSESVYAGSFEGDYGARMRKIIAAEYRMLEERRKLAKTQNLTTALAAIALAGSVYAATVTTTASAATVAAFSGVSLMGSIWALNVALDSKAESEQVNEYFIARMAHASERQMSVQMEWLESKELITARGFAEFRNKTLTLYQSRVRSMAVATNENCRFRHPDVPETGDWFGACDDGMATGHGYGLIRQGDNPAVEYLGESSSGLASGQGAMVVRKAEASFFEGDFRNGIPNGDVLIEQAGQEPRLREFRDGRDVGRGDATNWAPLNFTAAQANP
jgi:hypothetical protein